MEKIKKLITPTNNKLEDDLVNLKKSLLGKLCPNIEDPRFGGKIAYDFDELINQFSILPVDGYEPNYVLSEIIGKLCKYVPNWRSPNLHYNVGAPINIVSSMAYSFALENNIFTINNALSGNTLIAESAVTNILSSLAGLNPDSTIGWFTFGGTGINLYGLKVGINKSAPLSRKNGINKNVKVFTTKNAHFGHFISTEWLGVGTDNVIIIDANKDGTTNISDFKNKLEYEIRNNSIIGCIYLNGGTSYNHIVDDIDEFVKFRDELTTKYQLSYKPHIHVDSVIGWFWLFFKGYNFIKNPLQIEEIILQKIKSQYVRISKIKFADSWGADFHKGIGGCPVDSSIFILNKKSDADLISKKLDSNIHMHQIAEEFSSDSPINYTLENSRSAGPMLSALASLMSMGKNGYRKYLSTLIHYSEMLKLQLIQDPHFYSCDKYNLGYVAMIRLYPDFMPCEKIGKDINSKSNNIIAINEYNRLFFNWDYNKRISVSNGVEYSYSTSFMTNDNGIGIHALKFYLTSPLLTKENITNCAMTLQKLKKEFDQLVNKNHLRMFSSNWKVKCM